MNDCPRCADDLRFLRRKTRPEYETEERAVRVVDLFSGCGGLSLGVAEAARRLGLGTQIALAVDIDKDATSVFRLNFPNANIRSSDISTLFDGGIGAEPTHDERKLQTAAPTVDVLVSGAPCQGHSDLNNHTRRRDPRNALYLRAVRAAEVLKPSYVLLENVPAVQHDRGGVVEVATEALEGAGYAVAAKVLDFGDLGVPQSRRRHFVLACRAGLGDSNALLELTSRCAAHLPRSVRWAIDDLRSLKGLSDFDSPSTSSSRNKERIAWLFKNGEYDLPNRLRPNCHRGDHSYRSMYGRLKWDLPAQTITTGFGSMGQGRYVHPSQRRTLTPHEAARLQTFPDFFEFGTVSGRRAWARMIGNAVPPLVGLQLSARLIPLIPWVGRIAGGTEDEDGSHHAGLRRIAAVA